MSKGTDKDNNKKIVVILLIITVIALALSIWAIFFRQPLTSDIIKENRPKTVEKNTNSISVPGYEGLTLSAGTLKQEISLSNPEQNTCIFVIRLYLEDGTLLWESEEIKPGKASAPIVLSQKLEKGTYPNAYLEYSCYTMDNERAPLNKANTKVSLRVK